MKKSPCYMGQMLVVTLLAMSFATSSATSHVPEKRWQSRRCCRTDVTRTVNCSLCAIWTRTTQRHPLEALLLLDYKYRDELFMKLVMEFVPESIAFPNTTAMPISGCLLSMSSFKCIRFVDCDCEINTSEIPALFCRVHSWSILRW